MVMDGNAFDQSYLKLCEELEDAYTRREEELVFFENIIPKLDMDADSSVKYRKALTVMLYSYFEGFCKQSLICYIDHLNKLGLQVKDVKDGLAAASINTSFKKLFDSLNKPIEFDDRYIKEDSILHEYARRKEFMGTYLDCMNTPVKLKDEIIDTKNNLYSSVLKKLLFMLDIDYTVVEDFQGDVNYIVGRRNSIAHGNLEKGMEIVEYNKYRSSVITLMRNVKDLIKESFRNKSFLRL